MYFLRCKSEFYIRALGIELSGKLFRYATYKSSPLAWSILNQNAQKHNAPKYDKNKNTGCSWAAPTVGNTVPKYSDSHFPRAMCSSCASTRTCCQRELLIDTAWLNRKNRVRPALQYSWHHSVSQIGG